MHRNLLRLMLSMAIVCAVSLTAFAQGRGRGVGQGRRSNVFADRDYRGNRGRSVDWKCGKFVNCHDARDGRGDGRGPRRTTGFWRDGVFVARGSNVGYRNRYSTNDYWRRRHLNEIRYRSRTWRY
jgi:hypothetical protein